MTGANRPINLQAIAQETLLRYEFLLEPPAAALVGLARLAEPDFRHLALRDLTG